MDMGGNVSLEPGGEPADDLSALSRAWKLVPSEAHQGERVVAFESWESFSTLITGDRRLILRHLHAHPETSVTALAEVLHRPFPRVHEDVMVLEMAGLVDRSAGALRVTADRLSVMLVL